METEGNRGHRDRPARGACVADAGSETPRSTAGTDADLRHVVVDTDLAFDDIMALLYLVQRDDVAIDAVTITGTGEAHCDPGVRNAVLAFGCLRIGEAAALQVSDLDLLRDRVTISKAATEVSGHLAIGPDEEGCDPDREPALVPTADARSTHRGRLHGQRWIGLLGP